MICKPSFLTARCNSLKCSKRLSAVCWMAAQTAFYEGKDGDSRYVDDYSQGVDVELDGFYSVADTWENYERLSVLIARRFFEWQAAGYPQYVV